MALPTIPNYWTRQRNIYEQAIVSRRNKENDYRDKWGGVANFFNKSVVQASKENSWTSDKSFQGSMDAYKKIFEDETKSINLKRRRLKLAELLESERKQYEAELKAYSSENAACLNNMKDRAEGLRSAREEKRKEVAYDKLYEHWKQNNTELRQVESDLFKEHVKEDWTEKVDENIEKLETARKEKNSYEKKAEKERVTAIEMEKRRKAERRKEEIRLKEIVRQQMIELKEREIETERLKKEQDALLRHQWEVDALEEQRSARDQRNKKHELGRVLLRQHIAQMKRKSRQIREELEEDRKTLEALIYKEKDELNIQTARREKRRADASWMKQVIDDQLQLEKAREAELDMLFQEEAARMWEKRAGEWERERQARERLMKEVLEGRHEQLDDKLAELHERQVESLQRREELLRDMELANQLTQREVEDEEKVKTERQVELREQMDSRAVDREDEDLKLRLDEEQEKHDYEENERFLTQETERLRLQGYTPRNFGRSRQAWS